MMNVTDYTNIKTLLVKFKEKSDVLYAKAAALSNYATIEWVNTQIPSVGNGTVTIKQNGTSKGSFSMNQSGGATINLTDTTYSSLPAVSGGTDKSLVTTGEKYTWNNKQAAISDLATIRSNAATAYGWGDHSKAGYLKTIATLTINGTAYDGTTPTTVNFPTSLPANGGNADTVDGLHASSFAQWKGCDNVDTAYDFGFWRMFATGSGSPTGKNNSQFITVPYRKTTGNTTPDFAWQILAPNGDDPTHPEDFYVRTGLSKTWNPWRKLYHSGNVNKIDVNWICNIMTSMGISSPYSDVFDANNPDRWINSNYGTAEKNYSNMPDGWEFGTVLTIGQQNYRGINGNLNAQFVWDVQHSEDANHPGRLWWRTKNEKTGWKNWQELLHTGNYSSYALPRTGGTITGSIKLEGDYPSIVPFVRNFKSATAGGWSRAIAEIRVDNKNAFRIAAYGSYTPNAENNKIQYAYLGFASYNGLNLRISETSLSWGDNVIYHSGNCNLSTIPWTCSSLTAANFVSAIRGKYGLIEFSNLDSSAGHGGYIDFHYNGNAADYTSRIIEDASGQLTLSAGIVNIGTAAKGFLYLQRPSTNYIWANKAGGEICIGTADGGETSALNSGITIIGKRVYIGGTNSGSNALNVKGAIHTTTGLYTDGYISAKQASASSDRRLKKDFCKIDNALKYVLKTHYTRFRWKDDNKESIGIIAQEEQNREYGFLVQNNEKIGHLTYDYAASTALLGAAIQEEDSKVEKLKKRVAELEKELSNLKRKCQH